MSELLYLTPSLVVADDGENVYPSSDRKSPKKYIYYAEPKEPLKRHWITKAA